MYHFNGASLLNVTKRALKSLFKAASESFLASDRNICIWSSKNPLFSLWPQVVGRTEDKACYFRFPGLYFVYWEVSPSCTVSPLDQLPEWMLAWILLLLTLPYLPGKLVCSATSSMSRFDLVHKRHLWTVHLYLLRRKKIAAKYNYCLEF